MNLPIKNIKGESGELLATIDDRRYLIARCRPSIKIYEQSNDVFVLGSIKCQTKTTYAAIVICVDKKVVRDIDISQWENATKFELVGNFERWDGIIEKVILDDIIPIPQNLSEEIWEFEITKQTDLIKKLIRF